MARRAVTFTSADCAALRRLPPSTLTALRVLIREIQRAASRRQRRIRVVRSR